MQHACLHVKASTKHIFNTDAQGEVLPYKSDGGASRTF